MDRIWRKVNLVGRNTLTVSLPSSFVLENGVSKGDELFTLVEGESVIFSVDSFRRKGRCVSLKVNCGDVFLIERVLDRFYFSDCTKVVLFFESDVGLGESNVRGEWIADVVKRVVDERFVGVDVVFASRDRVEVRFFLIDGGERDFDEFEREIFVLFDEFVNDFIGIFDEGVKVSKVDFERKFGEFMRGVRYFIRRVEWSCFREKEKREVFLFYIFLLEVSQRLKGVVDKVYVSNFSEEFLNLLRCVFDLFFEGVNFKKFDSAFVSKVRKCLERCDDLSFLSHEMLVLSECRRVLEGIFLFFDCKGVEIVL